MANPTVGGITFLRMAGAEALNCGWSVEDITRPGVSGHAYRYLGKRATPVSVICQVDSAAPATLRASCLALKGTLVTVALPEGGSLTSVMVLDVEWQVPAPITKVCGGVVGASATHWCTVQFRLQGTVV